MPIHFQCPHCSTRLKVPDELVGKTGRCRACQKAVRVPNVNWQPLSESVRLPSGTDSIAKAAAVAAKVTPDRSEVDTSIDSAQKLYWLWTVGTPSGPFDVGLIHARLAAGEILWQTQACAVGSCVWRTLLETPGFGPHPKVEPGASTTGTIATSLTSPLPTVMLASTTVRSPTDSSIDGGSSELGESNVSQPSPESGVTKSGTAEVHVSSGESLTSRTKRNLLLVFVVGTLFIPTFGGTLSAASVILLAFASFVVGFILFWLFCRPDENDEQVVVQALAALGFTAVVGIFVLFVFQNFADWAASSTKNQHHPLFLIVKVIGWGYRATSEGGSFWGTLLAVLVSVAPCEELVKLFPAASPGFLTGWGASKPKRLSFRNNLFIGAMSGLGFGISEGLFYSYNLFMPMELPLSVYLLRFFGVAYMHSVWTILTLTALHSFRKEDVLKDTHERHRDMAECGIFVVFAVIVGVPHAVYDAFVLHNLWLLAAFTNVVVVLIATQIEINADSAADFNWGFLPQPPGEGMASQRSSADST